jgi:hypothetical protein
MGLIGAQLGELGGEWLGGQAAKRFGVNEGLSKKLGGTLGKIAGELTPFKKGGMVKKKTQKALLHKGEMVIPKSMVSKIPKSVKKAMKKKGALNM